MTDKIAPDLASPPWPCYTTVMSTIEKLLAISPIDGRYSDRVNELQNIVSEYGLIKYRLQVEALWLKTLGSGILPDTKPLNKPANTFLDKLIQSFDVEKAIEIKNIEQKLNHDVKSVEVWLTQQLPDNLFKDYKSLVHFGCTSEDINNLSHALMIRDTLQLVLMPNIENITNILDTIARANANIPMLARTHGQAASPVTLGKEMRVFVERLKLSSNALTNIAVYGKFNGATGGYSAATITYPEIDWPVIAKKFVENELALTFNPVTTQIEPHDYMARVCNELVLTNTIMTDLATDIWQYISVDYFTQELVKGEVGSSTMPHKVNPINFENAEGNFGVANAIFHHLATKLPQSRLQRDLSDSTAIRAISEAFAHTLIGQKALQKGLKSIRPNAAQMSRDLDDNWAVLTEAVQSVMRRYGATNAYDAIKAASRGKNMTKTDYIDIVHSIDLPEQAKTTLLNLTPQTYIGRSVDIALIG